MEEMEVTTDCKLEEIRAKNRVQTAERRKEKVHQILTIKRKLTKSESGTVETAEKVAELCKDFKKRNQERKICILKILSNSFTHGEEFISTFLRTDGALYALIGCLTSHNEKLQTEAVSCLINLSLGGHKSTFICVKASSAYLIAYLGSGNTQFQELCMWALGNFAADCYHCCDILRLQGFVPANIKLLNCPSGRVRFASYFALSCYTYTRRNGIDEEILQSSTCEKIFYPLTVPENSLETTAEAASILFNLTTSGKYDELLHSAQAIDKILYCLSHSLSTNPDNIQIITPLVRSLGNLCSADPAVIAHCLTFPSMSPSIQLLVNSRYTHLVKETLWVVSNIVSCIEGLPILNDALLSRVAHLTESISSDVSVQALACLCNLAAVSQVHCHVLAVNFNIFHKLKQLLLRLDEETSLGALTLANILMEKCSLVEETSLVCQDFLSNLVANLEKYPKNIEVIGMEMLTKYNQSKN